MEEDIVEKGESTCNQHFPIMFSNAFFFESNDP